MLVDVKKELIEELRLATDMQDRMVAVERAMNRGMPLNEIEALLDHLDDLLRRHQSDDSGPDSIM